MQRTRAIGLPPIATGIFKRLDRSRKRRAEAAVRDAVSAAGSTGCALGLFDAGGDVARFEVFGTGIDDRTALTLLSAVPLPETPGPVTLKVKTAHASAAPLPIGVAIPLGAGGSLALVVLRPPSTETLGPEFAEKIQRAARAIADDVATLKPRSEPWNSVAIAGVFQGFFILNADFEVQRGWYTRDAAGSSLAKLVEPQDRRLPVFLERAIRRLTSGWNLERLGSCAAATGRPIPGLTLRVLPMSGSDVMIGVCLHDNNEGAHAMELAAAAFHISDRERDVLHHLLDGSSVAEIADALNLAESTVNDHIARIIAKTNSRNRIEMAAKVLGWPAIRNHVTGNGEGEAGDDPGTWNESGEEPPARVSWRYNLAATPMGTEPRVD
jgi:DNA-binding CsgD family transcriptional regulator